MKLNWNFPGGGGLQNNNNNNKIFCEYGYFLELHTGWSMCDNHLTLTKSHTRTRFAKHCL